MSLVKNAPVRMVGTVSKIVVIVSLLNAALLFVPLPALADVPSVVIADRSPRTTPVARATHASAASDADEPLPQREDLVAAAETSLDPFQLLGVSMSAAPTDPVLFRTAGQGGWSSWTELSFGDEAPDAGTEGTERPGFHSAPVWVGSAAAYEILLPRSGRPVVHLGREVLRRQLVEARPARAAAAPAIAGRGTWGARPPKETPVEADAIDLAVVHHSDTTNGYLASDVPAILRSIQAYHMDVRGWNDIGYNFAVDRFGRTWEGRGGGTQLAVIGGHAMGFNTRSFGVVIIGNHNAVAPAAASVTAVADLIAWRFAVAGADPRGTVAYTTPSGSSKYAPGSTAVLNRVSGHRDVGLTSCPGELIQATLDQIRFEAAQRFPTYDGRLPTSTVTSPTRAFLAIGGASRSGPDIAATGNQSFEIVVRGLDDQLWRQGRNGLTSTGFEAAGGRIVAAPAVVGSADGSSEVFAQGGDGALWTIRRTAAGSWSPWASLGGGLTSGPDVTTSIGGDTTVVARGGDGAVWTRRRAAAASTWQPWESLGGGMPSGSAPAVASVGAGSLDLAVRGNDNALWTRSALDGRWGSWQQVGGLLSSGPSLASSGGGRLDVVVRGADGRLFSADRSQSGWSGFALLSLDPVGPGGQGLTSGAPGRLDVAVATLGGRIFHHWRSATQLW